MLGTEHEKLAQRLAGILLKLNQEETVTRQGLADEFGVTSRTIYRDLNRLGSVIEPLPQGRYQLAPAYRGKLHPKDLESFAKLAGVDGLFPSSSPRFLVALLDTLSQSSFLVRGHHYEKLKPQDRQFQMLDEAVRSHRRCVLTYADKRRTLEPYRLVNNKGIWYLAATEDDKLKAFSLSRISALHVREESFEPCDEVKRQIENDDDVWFNTDKTEVLLKVEPQVAYYFTRRKLLPQQTTVKNLEGGGLILGSLISHRNQILPIIRYWIPNIRILEPEWLNAELVQELNDFL